MPERAVPTFNERQEQQPQRSQKQHVHELSEAVPTCDPDQPGNEEYERNLEQHLASGAAVSSEEQGASAA
jgi:hypothetical protein